MKKLYTILAGLVMAGTLTANNQKTYQLIEVGNNYSDLAADLKNIGSAALEAGAKGITLGKETGKVLKSAGWEFTKAAATLIGATAQTYWNHPIEVTALGALGWCLCKDFYVKDIIQQIVPSTKKLEGRLFNGYHIAALAAGATFALKLLVNNIAIVQ